MKWSKIVYNFRITNKNARAEDNNKIAMLRLPKAGVFLYKKERHYIGVILMKTKIEKDLGMCDQKEREFMEELIANMNALCMQQLGGISLTVWNRRR